MAEMSFAPVGRATGQLNKARDGLVPVLPTARLAIDGQRSSRLRAVSLRKTSLSSSDSLGLTLAASSGSVLRRWSIVAVEVDAT